MFNYLKNGTAILKPNIAIGPVKGPKYPFKFSSFKCLAGKWLDSSNVLTVQGNWGSLERKATFGEILIVLMIDRDFCWGWQRLVLVIEMMISNETFHHLWKKKVKSNNWGWWTLFVYSRSCLGTKIREEWTHGELVIISLTINLWWWQWLLIIGARWHLYVNFVILLMFVRVQRIIDHRVSNFDIDDWYRRYYYLGRYWIITWRLGWLH